MSPSPESPKVREQALRWLTRLHSGEADQRERAAFQRWLSRDEAHWRAYGQARRLWNASGDLGEIPEIAEARRFRPAPRVSPWPRALAAGLSLMVVGLMGFSAVREATHTDVYRTAWGERRHLTLADGSEVDLNGDSELRAVWFPHGRMLALARGEASFRVEHLSGQPFEVYTGAGKVRDIGTRFAVRVAEGSTSVVVEEGEVEVSSGVATPRRLLRDQGLDIARDGAMAAPRSVNSRDLLAWREGRLVFKSQSLTEVLQQISRYQPVRFQVDDASLSAMKISGTFRIESLQPLLNGLETVLPLRVESAGPGLILIRRK
jgi:transmembrane sensor